jgi:23S rRNA (cytidine1920-2'-O)/16S rRNA (cytidine1409-2'-O)-methyltransferase
VRIDLALVAQGLARSRTHAQSLISSGQVQLNGQVVAKPSQPVQPNDELGVQPDHYVSRAAYKLLGAVQDLGLQLGGRALDAGASTGGFTQVLLESGCQPVYAVDVGHAQLDPLLRADSRVVVHERTNLRELELSHLGGVPVNVVVADVSFISLVLLLQPLTSVLAADGDLVLMIKPQFEVGRERLGKNGVVRSPALHRDSIAAVLAAAAPLGWYPEQLAPSRLPGPSGNVEYFALLRSRRSDQPINLERVVEAGSRLG